MDLASSQETPDLPPIKVFKSKLGLPVLNNYRDPAPPEYWDKFPKNYDTTAKSLIDSKALLRLALECGYEDRTHLNWVVKQLEGAKIGCKGTFRNPSSAPNSSSSFADGEKVSDAIGTWVRKKFVRGPVTHKPPNVKISSIMTRPKPDNTVRVILNLSGPIGSSVNEGINPKEFPAKMSSTEKWIQVLNKAGIGCSFCKVDWSDAYKHIAVHHSDLDLQWFVWLGKFFAELCLIFGSASSAGIFDAVAKVLIFIVITKSGLHSDFVIQHLDDCCAAGPVGTDLCKSFDDTFSLVAKEVGVVLAPRDQPDKSFGPSTSGTVLGVFYNTQDWTWGIPSKKLTLILRTIAEFLSAKKVKQGEMWSLVGKIQNVRALVPGGKFHVDHLIRANSESTNRTDWVLINSGVREQLEFWKLVLPLCSNNVRIPPRPWFLPAWSKDIFTDAAGGSLRHPGQGVGACYPGWYTYLPWGCKINNGLLYHKKRLDRKLSALELLGPLLVLSSGHEFCRNSPIRVHVDNAGSVFIFHKGYSSSCRLTTTIAKAIWVVARGIRCDIEVVKILRCSQPMAVLADHLSKFKLKEFVKFAFDQRINMPAAPAKIPDALRQWVLDPKEDDSLGFKILKELSLVTEVLGY